MDKCTKCAVKPVCVCTVWFHRSRPNDTGGQLLETTWYCEN